MAASTAAPMGVAKVVLMAEQTVARKVVRLAAKLAHPMAGMMADNLAAMSVVTKAAVMAVKWVA